MKKFWLILSVFFITTVFAEPENLNILKMQLKHYHDSGQYTADIDKVTAEAQAYLAKRIVENQQTNIKKKLAVVFDIDETSLSNYQNILTDDFGYIPKLASLQIQQANDPAIAGTLKLYKFAKANHVAIFFISGRHENLKDATIKNLQQAGYTTWSALYLTPLNYHEKSIIPFKSSVRKSIAAAGYDIVFSIGDQDSDLQGGYEDKPFKLPNPFYYIS